MARPPKSETTHEDLLAAARTLLVAHGVDNVSLRQIAKAAGYSPSSLYNYFDSKDAILAELATGANARLADALAQADTLAALGKEYVRFALENREDFELLFRMTPSKRRTLAQPSEAASAYTVVLNAVVDAQKAGEFAGHDPEHIAYGIWSLAHGQATLQTTMLDGFEADFPTIDSRIFEAFLEGLR